MLAGIVFSDEVLDWVQEMTSAGTKDEEHARQMVVDRLEREHRRLQDRIEAMYVDKLDGRVDQDMYDCKAAEWRFEQAEIGRQLAAHRRSVKSPVSVRALAARAIDLFKNQAAREKRKLLDFVVARCSWKNGVLTPAWRPPFDALANEGAVAA